MTSTHKKLKTVVFCLPGSHFPQQALASWTNLLMACPAFHIDPILKLATSPNIYQVRNYCLDSNKDGPPDQLPFQGKIDYDYIMWIDSDIIYTPTDFHELFVGMENSPNLNILSGFYLLSDNQYVAVHDQSGKRLTSKAVHQLTGVTAVQSTGLGFTLIKHGVLESLSHPWFQPLLATNKTTHFQNFLGEDVAFCYRAAQQGISTHIHPRVYVGHQKSTILR